jgi:hypothetical protein
VDYGSQLVRQISLPGGGQIDGSCTQCGEIDGQTMERHIAEPLGPVGGVPGQAAMICSECRGPPGDTSHLLACFLDNCISTGDISCTLVGFSTTSEIPKFGAS